MKTTTLTLLTALLFLTTTSAVAWYDRDYYPAFRDYPGGFGDHRTRHQRPGSSFRSSVHIERGTYEGGYLLRVYTRGIKPEDIEVDADRGRIRLRSEMSSQRAWQDEYRRSRIAGFSSFTRSIPLPYDADPGKMEVTASDELLEIRIPRRQHSE